MIQPEAGNEMDALIQEQVMGIAPKDVRVRGEVDTPLVRVWNASEYWREDGRHDRYQLRMHAAAPPYSTDIALAMTLVDVMAKEGYQVNLTIQPTKDWGEEDQPSDPDKLWRCLTHISGTDMCWTDGYAETAPLAICRCAIEMLPDPDLPPRSP